MRVFQFACFVFFGKTKMAVWKTISQLIELTTLYVISKMHILLLVLTYLMCFNIFTVQSFPYRPFGFLKENKSAFLENQSME